MTDEKSFKLYKDLGYKLKNLTREEKGAIFEAIFALKNGEEIPTDMPIGAAIAWDFILPMLQAAEEKYAEISEARAEAGRRGMERRWQNNKGITNDNKSITNDNKPITNDNKGITNDNNGITKDKRIKNKDIKEKDTKVSQKKSLSFDQAAAVVDEQCNESLKAELGKWTQYKYQRKEPYTHIGLTALISRANKAVMAHGCTAVEEVIEDSISSEYKGIVWDKLTRAAPKRRSKDDELDDFLKRKAEEDDENGLQPDSEFFEGLSRYDYASNL